MAVPRFARTHLADDVPADQQPAAVTPMELSGIPSDQHDEQPTDASQSDTAVAQPAEGEPNLIGRQVQRGTDVVRRIDRYQQQHPRLAFAYAVFKKFGDDRAGYLAALVSYYTFFSLFPLLLVFTTVLGFLLGGQPELQTRLLDSALSQFPVLGDELRTNIGTFKGSGLALAIGIVGTLWGGMGALEAMQNTMNTIWDVPIKRRPNLITSRIRSLIMLVILAATIGLSTFLSSGAAVADSWPVVGRLLGLVVTVGVNVALYLGAFKVLTERDLDWRTLLPGAVAAGVFFTILQALGGFYVTHVLTGASQVYGTFAIVLGLLSWLALLAQLSVLAAEINVVRRLELYPRSILGDPLTEGDKRALVRYAKVEERHPAEDVQVTIDQSGAPSEAEADVADVADPEADRRAIDLRQPG